MIRYAHTVYTSGMQEISSACPTGRLHSQLHFGNAQLTTDRHVSYWGQQCWCKLVFCFSSAVQQQHSSVVAEDVNFATLYCWLPVPFSPRWALAVFNALVLWTFQLLATFPVNHFWPHMVYSPPSMVQAFRLLCPYHTKSRKLILPPLFAKNWV